MTKFNSHAFRTEQIFDRTAIQYKLNQSVT